jgi:hypothetical protein
MQIGRKRTIIYAISPAQLLVIRDLSGGDCAMRAWPTSVVCIHLLAVAMLTAPALVVPARAQISGMPGSNQPSVDTSPFSPFGAPTPDPPPACRELLGMRDETGKHGQALQAAGKRKDKAQPDEICKLFKAFLEAETKMIKGLEENSQTCGVPPDTIKQVTASHEQASKIAKNVCEVAMRRPPPPRLDSGDFWRNDELRRVFGEPPFGQ